MDREVLTDAQWHRIENLLPGRVGYVGGTIVCSWRPSCGWCERVPHGGICQNTLARGTRSTCVTTGGVKRGYGNALAQEPDFEYAMIDSTIVRAHQHSAGGKGGLRVRPSGVREADCPPKSTFSWMLWEIPSR
jgi:transposase